MYIGNCLFFLFLLLIYNKWCVFLGTFQGQIVSELQTSDLSTTFFFGFTLEDGSASHLQTSAFLQHKLQPQESLKDSWWKAGVSVPEEESKDSCMWRLQDQVYRCEFSMPTQTECSQQDRKQWPQCMEVLCVTKLLERLWSRNGRLWPQFSKLRKPYKTKKAENFCCFKIKCLNWKKKKKWLKYTP